MSLTVNTEISNDDAFRILRYMNSNPVVVEKASRAGIDHDIERFCAYKQSVLNEEEASRDPTVGYLAEARNCRIRLLDSIDKAITIIHLLTNTSWGPGVPPTRFLSCRQSGPLRKLVSSAGDRNVVSELLTMVESTRSDINSDVSQFIQLRLIYDSLLASQFLVEFRTLPSGIVLVVDLMPLCQSKEISTCVISADGSLDLHPTIQYYLEKGFSLQFEPSYQPSSQMSDSATPLEKVCVAQQCVVDYMLVLSLLDDPVDTCKGGWIRVNKSRNIDQFGVEYIQATGGSRVWIGMSTLRNSSVRLGRKFLEIQKSRFADEIFS